MGYRCTNCKTLAIEQLLRCRCSYVSTACTYICAVNVHCSGMKTLSGPIVRAPSTLCRHCKPSQLCASDTGWCLFWPWSAGWSLWRQPTNRPGSLTRTNQPGSKVASSSVWGTELRRFAVAAQGGRSSDTWGRSSRPMVTLRPWWTETSEPAQFPASPPRLARHPPSSCSYPTSQESAKGLRRCVGHWEWRLSADQDAPSEVPGDT